MPNKIYEIDGYPIGVGEGEPWMIWYDLAQSYRRAVGVLLQAEVPERNNYSERDLFPILFNFKHYVELIFKCLLVKNKSEIKTDHDIILLLKDVKKTHPNIEISNESINFLKFLYNLDKKGDAFRYPTNKKFKEFFPANPNGTSRIIRLSDIMIIMYYYKL